MRAAYRLWGSIFRSALHRIQFLLQTILYLNWRRVLPILQRLRTFIAHHMYWLRFADFFFYCPQIVDKSSFHYQLVKRIEAVVGVSKRRAAQAGDHTFVCHPTAEPTPASEADLLVIKRNPLLSGIVTKCLSRDPSQRPTARALRDQLLSVCRRSIFAAIGSDLWKT